MTKKRYFTYLSYNGKCYCGWQNQPNGISVQQKIEEAISTLLQKKISITGAGRTDAGVHAAAMVAHFDWWGDDLDLGFICKRLNCMLPHDIAIQKIVPVVQEGHARFSAMSRTYKYYITQKKNPFHHDFSCRIYPQLDFVAMHQAAQCLLEYTDFTSFSKVHTDVKTNNCKIHQAGWEYVDEMWVFTIQADRFLRNMVRAIVGTMLEVGRGKCSLPEFRQVIEAKDRGKAGSSAFAQALFLCDIEYPKDIFMNVTDLEIKE
ncbi:tRNA pseudouridine(38-40) synthase [Bacteroidales bacterium]|nr:tRNA pseudouridine(38-40) synthase [Bacteroidales bacterium]